jgi:short-subunit dehydrogenase
MMERQARKAIVIGATAGIGRAVAAEMTAAGWTVGLTGRRKDMLESFKAEHPEAEVYTSAFDVTAEDADVKLLELVEEVGDVDLIFMVSGFGKQNPEIDPELETATMRVNGMGFIRMVSTAFTYFKKEAGKGRLDKNRRGHIAIVSSIAGTKGLGVAPSYSATKKMQSTYIDALVQLSGMKGLPIDFTDIRPGFVKTDFLNSEKHYPMTLSLDTAAKSIFKALCRRRRKAVIDWKFAIITGFWSCIPQCIWERLRIVKN